MQLAVRCYQSPGEAAHSADSARVSAVAQRVRVAAVAAPVATDKAEQVRVPAVAAAGAAVAERMQVVVAAAAAAVRFRVAAPDTDSAATVAQRVRVPAAAAVVASLAAKAAAVLPTYRSDANLRICATSRSLGLSRTGAKLPPDPMALTIVFGSRYVGVAWSLHAYADSRSYCPIALMHHKNHMAGYYTSCGHADIMEKAFQGISPSFPCGHRHAQCTCSRNGSRMSASHVEQIWCTHLQWSCSRELVLAADCCVLLAAG